MVEPSKGLKWFSRPSCLVEFVVLLADWDVTGSYQWKSWVRISKKWGVLCPRIVLGRMVLFTDSITFTTFLMKYETIFWWVYQPYVFLRGLVLMTGFECHCGKAARGLLSTERKYLWELHVDTNLIGTCFFYVFHWIFTNRSFRSRQTSNHGLKVDFAHEYNLSKTKTISWCSIKVSNKSHPILSKFWEKVKSFFFLLAVIIV